jgi:hypothetical protein
MLTVKHCIHFLKLSGICPIPADYAVIESELRNSVLVNEIPSYQRSYRWKRWRRAIELIQKIPTHKIHPHTNVVSGCFRFGSVQSRDR